MLMIIKCIMNNVIKIDRIELKIEKIIVLNGIIKSE